jgi:hypothetical protein
MGPEALATYVNPTEILKRLSAASGIDSLGLIKTPEELDAEKQQAQQQAMQAQVMGQMGQLAKSPIAEQLINAQQQQQPESAPAPGPSV